MPVVLVTCEHARGRVPLPYSGLFRNSRKILTSHHAYDIGAEALSSAMARRLDGESVRLSFTWTRLLIDANRSLSNPHVFSRFSRRLPEAKKRNLLERYYLPYRSTVRKCVDHWMKQGKTVVHLSVHTFTPVWKGLKRRTDIGFLYDPSRKTEKRFILAWKTILHRSRPDLVIRRNAPYRGVSDGLAAALRREYGERHFIGLELEVNQKFPKRKTPEWSAIKRELAESFRLTVDVYAQTDARRNLV